jgi:uncharacterized protein (TIGR02231 family)
MRESASAQEVNSLEAEVDRTEFAQTAAKRAESRARAQRTRILAAEKELLTALSRAPAGVDGWSDAFSRFDEQLSASFDELADAKHAVEVAQRDSDRACDRWRVGVTARPRIVSTVELQLEVSVDADGLDELELEFVYLVPCALWRPSHVARLDVQDPTAKLTMLNEATVWQRTGEDWDGIEARFSTARPSREVSPPLLQDDELYAQPKQELRVEGRDVTIEKPGAKGARELDEMPGVDDGGEPLVLDASGKVTIPSDGEPSRVELGSVELETEVTTVAYPEYGPTPHIRGRAHWKGERPLLAGPVRVMRNDVYVGVARLDFVAPGAVLEMGFGRDSGVTVRRTTTSESKSTMTGGARITKVIKLFCSNLSDQTRKIWIVERIPVSELEEVKVSPVDAAGGALDDDGFLQMAIELRPHATEKREISYRIEHGSSVNLRL